MTHLSLPPVTQIPGGIFSDGGILVGGLSNVSYRIFDCFKSNLTKVRPNQIRQGQDDAHSLNILVRSTLLPYLIGSYFNMKSTNNACVIQTKLQIQATQTFNFIM